PHGQDADWRRHSHREPPGESARCADRLEAEGGRAEVGAVMTSTQQAGRAPAPSMMHSTKVYASEAEQRADAAERKQRLMGTTSPAARITVRSWSHAPAPLPVVPDWWAVSQEARKYVL